METLYRKVGKKYIPVSSGTYEKEIPYGLWYTQKTDHGSRGTSIPYFLGDIADIDYVKLPELIKIMSCDSEVSKIIMDAKEESISANELAHRILRYLYIELS